MAYVLVTTKPGTSHELIGSRKIRGVKMANSVFGRYDAVLVISADSMEELSSTIYDVVEKHPNVEHTGVPHLDTVSIEREAAPAAREVHGDLLPLSELQLSQRAGNRILPILRIFPEIARQFAGATGYNADHRRLGPG